MESDGSKKSGKQFKTEFGTDSLEGQLDNDGGQLSRTVELPGDSSEESPDFLRASDLQSLQIRVRIENITAGTHFPDTPRTAVLQILDKGLILEVPEKNCATGHNVVCDLVCVDGSFKAELRATGKVESVDHFQDHKDRIKVKLVQFPEDPWEALQKHLKDRQDEITDFLIAAGGR